MSKASGELVINAGGDDVSMPNRTEVLTAAWVAAGRPAGIGSAMRVVDKTGNLLRSIPAGEFVRLGEQKLVAGSELVALYLGGKQGYWLNGCCAGWSRESWALFGELDPRVVYEDGALSFRAGLLGGMYAVKDELLLYRQHETNTSSGGSMSGALSYSRCKVQAQKMQDIARSFSGSFATNKKDLQIAKEQLHLDPECCLRLEKHIEQKINLLKIREKWWHLNFVQRLAHHTCAPGFTARQKAAAVLGLQAFSLLRFSSLCLKRMFSKSTP